jgi:acyl carrier protein
MKEKKILTSPIDLVTKVLELKPGIVNQESAMGETPNWDSLNHVAIIGEIENSYGITIPNDQIEKYVTMKAIIDVYNKQSGNDKSSGQRFIEILKKLPIIKIFFK